MSTEKQTKINQLLSTHPTGAILLAGWLARHGYSLDLQKRYRRGGWLTSVGTGAMIRAGEKVSYEGAIYALQKQAGLTVHLAARTALALQGKAHYLELATKKVTLFGGTKEKLPLWFQRYEWSMEIDHHATSFLPPDIGMVDFELKTFSIKVSSPARALMECLYLAPKKQGLIECYELMEGLNNLRPQQVQALLEQCQSVKVKRLFLYLAEKAGHEWFKYLDLKKVSLGKGKRSLAKSGTYVAKYQITVPKELEAHE
jgi:hypothetical protein